MAQFTPKQQEVIDAPITNILCGAAAGSGKTTVLVQRIINQTTGIGESIPKNLIDIDKILVVTFTKNAAATMKERLASKLSELCEKYPDNKRIIDQKNKVLYSDIMTIDSFCSKVVKSYCYTSEIEPGFIIGDESKLKIIKKEAIKDVCMSYYEKKDKLFLDLVNRYSGAKNDSAIESMIDEILKKSESSVDVREYIKSIPDNYGCFTGEEMLTTPVVNYFIDYVNMMFKSISCSIDNLIAVCRKYGEEKFESLLVADGDIITGLMGLDYNETKLKLAGIKFKNNAFDTKDEELKRFLSEARDRYKKSKGIIDNIKKMFEEYNLDEVAHINQELYTIITKLSEVCLDVYHEIMKRKKKLNMYGFSDIAHEALRIIKNNQAVREELMNHYEQIMIDEYQDSNDIQEELLSSISGELYDRPNMFMVGDVKQSIYKFRQAKPELIRSKMRTYEEDKDATDRLISLNKNFRSSKKVVDTVNHAFYKLMSAESSDIDYSGQELVCGADYREFENRPQAVSELILVNKDNIDKKAEYELVCNKIAAKINEIINDEEFFIYEKGEKRRACYKDIAVLTRSKTGVVPYLATYLPDNGIPAMVNTKTGYFTTTEIMYIINYLKIIDNPYKDIEFTAVLKTYPQCITDEELAVLKLYEREITDGEKLYMYTIAKRYCQSHNDDMAEKLNHFFDNYEILRDIALANGVSTVISAIYQLTDYCNFALLMPAGKLRAANLEMLYVKAKNFEDGNEGEISAFIHYIDNMKKYEISEGEANVGSGADFVSILTIHGSKGLEYPVVIIADLDKAFNTSDEKGCMIINDNLGFSLDYVHKQLLNKSKTFPNKVVSKAVKRENIAEEIRVLYVAMTRAMQKLIMIGTIDNTDVISNVGVKGDNPHLSFADIISSDSYLSMLLPAFLKSDNLDMLVNDGHLVIGDYLDICIVSDFSDLKSVRDETCDELSTKPDYREISEYFDYRYPYNDEFVPVKYSVSELKHEKIDEYDNKRNELFSFDASIKNDNKYVPSFIEEAEEKTNTGALRGTLYHLFMEHVIKTGHTTCDELKEYADEMIANGLFTEEINKYVDYKKIERFLMTDTAAGMRGAYEEGRLFLEQPFVIGVPACELKPDTYKSSELIMIQGVIDAFYETDDGAVLLDYKTDKVDDNDGEEILRGHYTEQLQLYARAIEQIRGIKVNSLLIYSFSLEKIIEL